MANASDRSRIRRVSPFGPRYKAPRIILQTRTQSVSYTLSASRRCSAEEKPDAMGFLTKMPSTPMIIARKSILLVVADQENQYR